MNVLIIQENGRHDANREFRECYSLKRAFEYNGHVAEVWGLGHTNYNNSIDFNSYDLIFNLENYGDHWLPDLKQITKPIKVLWSIDAHCRGSDPYEQIFKRGNYTYLLHATKDFVKQSYHKWFPNAYDDDLIIPTQKEKTVRFGFCGNYANRKQILEWLQQNYGLHLDIFVIGQKMVEAVNSYKCHFNLNIANDINYRSFETIGCGTLLLTNYNPVYEEMGFQDKKNCLMYKTKQDLIDSIYNIESFVSDNIRHATLQLAKENTYKKRIESFLKNIL